MGSLRQWQGESVSWVLGGAQSLWNEWMSSRELASTLALESGSDVPAQTLALGVIDSPTRRIGEEKSEHWAGGSGWRGSGDRVPGKLVPGMCLQGGG